MADVFSDIEQMYEAEYLEPDCTQREIRAFRDGWNCAWEEIGKQIDDFVGKNEHTKETSI